MGRIPARGTLVVVSPDWSEIEIRAALTELCPDYAFAGSPARDLFWWFGGIVGVRGDRTQFLWREPSRGGKRGVCILCES
jgi:hypothetical protein